MSRGSGGSRLGWIGLLDPRKLRTRGQRLAAALLVGSLVALFGSWIVGSLAQEGRYDALPICDQPRPHASDCLSAVAGEVTSRRSTTSGSSRKRYFHPSDDAFGRSVIGKRRGSARRVDAGLYLDGDFVGLRYADGGRWYRKTFLDLPGPYLVTGVLGLVGFGIGVPVLGWQARRGPQSEPSVAD